MGNNLLIGSRRTEKCLKTEGLECTLQNMCLRWGVLVVGNLQIPNTSGVHVKNIDSLKKRT